VLDSRIDLIARATRRPEHNDCILIRGASPISKLEGQQMMTFKMSASNDFPDESQTYQASGTLIFAPSPSRGGVKLMSGGEP
jgi:hypothetical protein